MNAFLIDGKWVTDKNDIRDGKPSVSPCFDHEFSDRVATHVKNIFVSCQNELPVTLNEPLQYQEVFNVCSKLKSGVSGVLIDYEHIRFGGPILWKLLHDLYQVFFDKSSVCKTLKTGSVLRLFKGKNLKANSKDNYRGITLFPTLCKIYEIIIITHSAGQTYVLHGCKWNFAGPQIYLQPAKIKSQYFGVSLEFLVCN